MTQATSAPVERKTPNYELLKDAYQIIDGIPASQFNLQTIARKSAGAEAGEFCGTIACAAGWLGLHPDFQARGFSVGFDGLRLTGSVRMKGVSEYFYTHHVAALFSVTTTDAMNLFGIAGESKYDKLILEQKPRLSHKGLWKARVIAFLTEHNALTPKVPAC